MSDKLNYSLSESEVLRLAGKGARMFTYPEIARMNKLDQLVNSTYPKAIILYMTSGNSGHWCGLKLMDGSLYFFDSYGTFPDVELEQIRKMKGDSFADETDQIHKKLTELIKKSPIKNVFYSQYKLQKLKSGINTCGRWVGMWLNSHMDENQFNAFIQKVKLQLQKESNKKNKKLITNDDVIVYLTNGLF